MREIELSKFKPVKERRKEYGARERSQPFAIAFVYPKNGESIVVKGLSEQVTDYIDGHYTNAVYNISFWENGKARVNYWSFAGRNRIVTREKGKYMVGIRNPHTGHWKDFFFKRMPNRWIDKFDFPDEKE